MATLTNRQLVLREAARIGGKMTDRKFFLSKQVGKYFLDLALGLTKRYATGRAKGVGVKVVDIGPDTSAYTDHRNIVINISCGLWDKLPRTRKFLCLTGVLFHECSHILYTDQKAVVRFRDALYNSKEILYPPFVDYADLENYIKTKNKEKAFFQIWKNIWNILEDGYIEYRFLDEYPRDLYHNGITAIRNLQLEEARSLKQLIEDEKEKEENKLFSVVNLLLYYCKYGKLDYSRKEFSDERIQAIIKVMPYVDMVNETQETEDHMRSINSVVAILSDYIITYLDTIPEDNAGGENQASGDLSKNIDSGATGENGADAPSESETENTAESPMAPPRKSSGKSSTSEDNESESEEETGQNSGSGESDEEDDESSSESAEGSEDENDRANSDDESESGDGGVGESGAGSSELSDEDIEEAAKRVEKLLQQAAEEEAEETLEREVNERDNEWNNSLDYGACHRGVPCTIERDTEVTPAMREAWERNKAEVNRLVKATVKGLKQILKDRSTGGVQRGLYFGKSIAPVSYSRYDKKYFQNKKLPTNSPTLSVCLILDESGSMDGDRIDYARLMAMVVFLFCKELDIRLKIMGHTEFGGEVSLKSYTDYNGSFDNNDLYRLTQIRAKSSNRDGYALLHGIKSLEKEPSDMKLCIMVSDGQPAASSYYGELAYDDLRSIKKHAKLKGIDVIAAAIGSDKEQIRMIYGDESFLDISDLEKLPRAITGKIKTYLPKVV